MERFNSLINEVHGYNIDKDYKLGRAVGARVFFSHSSFSISILYGKKKLIIDEEISSIELVNPLLLVIYFLLFILLF